MRRWLAFFVVVVLAAVGAVWLAERPGWVSLEWGGYRIDTSFAVLIGAVAATAALAAVLYRFWIFLTRAPGRLNWAWRSRRRQRGYQALTRGMVAVAAGDADEARRQAHRAGGLLDEPPLTMLVSAQAAQMNGDEKAASGYFTAMMDAPETEFLGLRGLLTQAMKRGDTTDALDLARRAYRLQPKSAWVAASLFDLQVRSGQWLDARVTCDDLVKRKLIDRAEARRRKAVLSTQLGRDAKARGERKEAVDRLVEASRLAPGFVPAVADLAALWIADDRKSKAARLIEDAWATEPHPVLVEHHWRARGADDALARVRATERLAGRHPDHAESLIALARAALEAQLWGEARKHLDAAADQDAQPPARVCRLMAELEEQERGDGAKAREWLIKASQAPADPTWVCGHCGNAVAEWSTVCAKCEGFDSFEWRAPPSVESLAEPAFAESDAPARLPAGTAEAG